MAFQGYAEQNAEKTVGFTEMMERPLTWPSVDVITPACAGCYDTGCFFHDHLINKMQSAKIGATVASDPLWKSSIATGRGREMV